MGLPDIARAVSLWLRSLDDLVAVLGDADRVYTVTPVEVGGAPFVLVRRVGGAPPLPRPLVLDQATLQCDCYGGTQRQAQLLARAVQAALAELTGVTLDDGLQLGHVTGLELGPFRDVPDESFASPRPRYLVDVDVFVKGGAASPAAASRTVPAVTGAAHL